ncbi:MAG: hypothetical protein MR769_08160, partial [Campylobacter sp.]|nr:hypothetical protein [Campylobacter sp.]
DLITKNLEFPSFLQPLSQTPKGSTNLEFLSLCHCEGAKRSKQSLGILEFLSLVSSPDLTFFVIPRLDRGMTSQNIDPPVKPEDDIVENSRIPYRDTLKGMTW